MSCYYIVLKSGGWSYGMGLSGTDPLYLKATTITLAAIVVTQIANSLSCRTTKESLLEGGFFTNRYLVIGITLEIILILLIVYVPPMQKIFGTVSLNLTDWLLPLPFAALLLGADEIKMDYSKERRAINEFLNRRWPSIPIAKASNNPTVLFS